MLMMILPLLAHLLANRNTVHRTGGCLTSFAGRHVDYTRGSSGRKCWGAAAAFFAHDDVLCHDWPGPSSGGMISVQSLWDVMGPA